MKTMMKWKFYSFKSILSRAEEEFDEINGIQVPKQLAVPIIYMLLWSEYNYRHALELLKWVIN